MDRKESNLSFKNIFRREMKVASYVIICLTVVVLSLSYAMFFQVEGNSNNQVVKAGNLVFTYTEGNLIDATNESDCFVPMSNDQANLYLGVCDYQFSVQNTGSLNGAYSLRVFANSGNTITNDKVKVILRQQVGDQFEVVDGYENGVTLSTLTNGVLLTEESMAANDIRVYSIQLYVDEAAYVAGDIGKTLSYSFEGTGLVNEG